jgi:hypothetical protein
MCDTYDVSEEAIAIAKQAIEDELPPQTKLEDFGEK